MPSAVKGSSKVLLSATLSVLLGIGVVVGVGYTLNGASDDGRDPVVATMAGNIDTPKGNMPHATATLSVYADAESSEGAHGPDGGGHPGYVTYGPSNHLILPANSLITITIKGYDGGESLNTPFFGKVIGTVDGSMDVDGKKVTLLGMKEVQHTFTIHGVPTSTQDPLFVNIPLSKQPDDAMEKFDEDGALPAPVVTTFSFYTGGAGEYVWNCEFPCGDGTYAKFGAAMSKYGYMSGKVSVVDHI
jgi:hypothetical protein